MGKRITRKESTSSSCCSLSCPLRQTCAVVYTHTPIPGAEHLPTWFQTKALTKNPRHQPQSREAKDDTLTQPAMRTAAHTDFMKAMHIREIGFYTTIQHQQSRSTNNNQQPNHPSRIILTITNPEYHTYIEPPNEIDISRPKTQMSDQKINDYNHSQKPSDHLPSRTISTQYSDLHISSPNKWRRKNKWPQIPRCQGKEIGAGLAHPSSTRDSSHPPSSTLIASLTTPKISYANPRPSRM